MIRKGQKIHGPDGQGYEVTRDINYGDAVKSDDFVSFGGAPDPHPGSLMPAWLKTALDARVIGGTIRVCSFD